MLRLNSNTILRVASYNKKISLEDYKDYKKICTLIVW